MNYFKKLSLLLFCLICFQATSQQLMPSRTMPSGEILLNLKKLNVMGSALYVAAHPDDENTVLLSWLAKERMVKTAYLSITRGDGGQNLIGPEQAELMGLIRTYELLAARSIDGSEQYFTRANDFGFSKTTDETLQIWNKEKVLADVVWRIRQQRPDVIICRFPPDVRAGHGNHSASAVLAEEAFKISGDPTKYPEQLKYVQVWQAKRILWNSFTQGFTNNAPADKGFVKVDIGVFNPLLGKAYTEIAAESRSQHKSQGFGVPRTRGQRFDFLMHKDGEEATADAFDGIDLSWKRIKGGEAIQAAINQVIADFKPENPSAIVPQLVKIYQQINGIEDEFWKKQKQKEIQQLIVGCAGIFLEGNPAEYAVAGGENVKVTATVIKRSDVPVKLEKLRFLNLGKDSTLNIELKNNISQQIVTNVQVAQNQTISNPYWLAQKKLSKGMYNVTDQTLIGLPEKPNDLQTEFTLNIAGQSFAFQTPLLYKWTDPVKGELYRQLEVRPEVTATLSDKVFIFADASPKMVEVVLKASKSGATGNVSLELPTGWKCEPASISFSFEKKFQEQKVSFKVTPTNGEGTMKAIVKSGNGTSSLGLITIDYDHIPVQTMFPAAEAKVVKLDIKNKAKNVGYIAGAGDDVPAGLRQMGCAVTMLTEKELAGNLSAYDAIVVGVRAYNTEERLGFYQKKLMEYVQNGGNMVVQYQVNSNLSKLEDGIGPYPFKLTRDRVTVEEAPIKFLLPQHAILNTPNKITDKDFENWVQERGLYFATGWTAGQYEAPMACNDPGEPDRDGGMLITKYGKGNYVFTGYAFFRQFPAGVSGAYRLFANLISLGK